MKMTYWNGKGKWQDKLDHLQKLMGNTVKSKKQHFKLLRSSSILYRRYYNDGDIPGEGESSEDGPFHDDFVYCLETLPEYIYMLDEPLRLNKNLNFTWISKFPWEWSDETLEIWMDATICHCFSLYSENRISKLKGDKISHPLDLKKPALKKNANTKTYNLRNTKERMLKNEC